MIMGVRGRLGRHFRGTPVEEFIARENIRRFEAQLATCADEKQRALLQKLLKAERERLEAAKAAKAARPES